MQRFRVDAAVGNPQGGGLRGIRPMVDTGADHAMLPGSLLFQLEIAPQERRLFALADGRRDEYDIGTARIALGGQERPCPVVFGPENRYLLGASTLEIFNLAVDPVAQRLEPEELLALGWGGLEGPDAGKGRTVYPVAVVPLEQYRIWLRYSDGTAGEVDLSPLVGQGVFAAWLEPEVFQRVQLDLDCAISWGDGLELCPDALYQQLTGQPAAAAMPGLTA